MKEKTLFRIALVCALMGVVILYTVSDNITIDEKSIDKINKDNVEESVKIKGKVESVSNLDNVAFLKVSSPSSVTVVIFGNVNVSEGQEVEVLGKIEEYDGKLEVIGKRIRVIK